MNILLSRETNTVTISGFDKRNICRFCLSSHSTHRSKCIMNGREHCVYCGTKIQRHNYIKHTDELPSYPYNFFLLLDRVHDVDSDLGQFIEGEMLTNIETYCNRIEFNSLQCRDLDSLLRWRDIPPHLEVEKVHYKLQELHGSNYGEDYA